MAKEQAPRTGNVNDVDQAEAAAQAQAAAKPGTPETLPIYQILHASVNGHPEGSLVSADDLGGHANLPRLFSLGAITL